MVPVNLGKDLDFSGRYVVDIEGNIFSKVIEGKIKPIKKHIDKKASGPNGKGYYKATLYSATGERFTRRVSRIVLESFTRYADPLRFIGLNLQFSVVDHINHDTLDDRLENLRWTSAFDNSSIYRRSDPSNWDMHTKKRICKYYFELHISIDAIAEKTKKSANVISKFLRGYTGEEFALEYCKIKNIDPTKYEIFNPNRKRNPKVVEDTRKIPVWYKKMMNKDNS